MKAHLPLFLALPLILAGTAPALEPQKAPLSRYQGLWTNSPFTAKPPPPETAPQVNPLDDWALIGISPIPEGYRITMLNRKNPEERIVVEPGHKEFKVLGITRRAGDPFGTVVRMTNGRVEGSVSFDENLLTLNPPPAAPQPQAQPMPGQPMPGVPGVHQPGQPVQGQPGAEGAQRQPRQRVIPPPAVPGNGGAQMQQMQQRGGGVPGAQGRPDRRGGRNR
jgi:hypothetical protein